MTEAFGIGSILPPIGIALYVACAICGAQVETREQAAAFATSPCMIAGLLLVAFVPWITTVLPMLAEFQVLTIGEERLPWTASDATARPTSHVARQRPARAERARSRRRCARSCRRVGARAQAAGKRIRFAHPAPTAHGWHIWAEQFKKASRTRAGGKLTVQIFPNAQMGNERDTAQAVRLGSLEMGAIGVGLMNWVPEMSITDAPFLWKCRAAVLERDQRRFRRRPAQALAREGLRAFRLDRPRLSQHDQQQAPDQQRQGHAEPQDARPQLEGVHRDDAGDRRDDGRGRPEELYLALRQGVADGQDTPPSVVKSNKFYEVQKYISKTDHVLTTAYTVTNPKFYDGLTRGREGAVQRGVQRRRRRSCAPTRSRTSRRRTSS